MRSEKAREMGGRKQGGVAATWSREYTVRSSPQLAGIPGGGLYGMTSVGYPQEG